MNVVLLSLEVVVLMVAPVTRIYYSGALAMVPPVSVLDEIRKRLVVSRVAS